MRYGRSRVDDDSVTVTAMPSPGIEITKRPDRETYVEGETVTCTFYIVNTGNLTLLQPTLTNWALGIDDAPFIVDGFEFSALAPGDSAEMTATWTASAADVERGYFRNEAAVSAWIHDHSETITDTDEVWIDAAV